MEGLTCNDISQIKLKNLINLEKITNFIQLLYYGEQ
jgi:hypothetical protein